MLRYYAIATGLVLALLAAVLALPHGPRGAGDPHFSSGRGTPGPFQRDDRTRTAQPTTGEAPWALDVLPECFYERSRASGTPAFVAARRPAGLLPIPAGTVLHVADCTLTIGAGRALVTRGGDRLLIPPLARFYRDGPRRIAFDRAARGREEIRIFDLRGATGF